MLALRKLFLLLCLLFISLATAGVASADTLTLTQNGPAQFGGASAGPYKGVLNSTPITMLCISFDRQTPLNQPWQVAVNSLTADGVANSIYGLEADALTKYRKAAWLFDQMALNPSYAGAIHGAVWNLFRPSQTPDTSGNLVGSNYWLDQAEAFRQSLSFSTYDYSRFRILSPTDTRISPQGFLTTVPEPASMLLLGTGLAGVAAGIRRRRKNVLASMGNTEK